MGTLKTVLKLLVVVPLALLAMLFAIANKSVVSVSLDPFSADKPAYMVQMPVFVLIFSVLMVGIVVGGVASWLAQGKVRRSQRLLRRQAQDLRSQTERLKAVAGTSDPHLPRSSALPSR